jgi:hypothetical protein
MIIVHMADIPRASDLPRPDNGSDVPRAPGLEFSKPELSDCPEQGISARDPELSDRGLVIDC